MSLERNAADVLPRFYTPGLTILVIPHIHSSTHALVHSSSAILEFFSAYYLALYRLAVPTLDKSIENLKQEIIDSITEIPLPITDNHTIIIRGSFHGRGALSHKRFFNC